MSHTYTYSSSSDIHVADDGGCKFREVDIT